MKSRNAFTLVEVIVVIAVIMLLTLVSLPSFNRMGRGLAVTTSGQEVVDQFNLARQIAQSRNCPVEVRLYKLPDPNNSNESAYRALQLFLIDRNQTNAVGQVTYLDKSVIISDNPSATSLMDNSELPEESSPTLPLPSVQFHYSYRTFLFKPDGSTSLSLDKAPWFLSVYAKKDRITRDNTVPDNFATIQIDPVTGRTKMFRP